MKVQEWPIGRVKPYGNNPRKIEAAVEAVSKSIREFGFRVPLVVDRRGVLIAGHVRLEAAKLLGLNRVPVHVASELSPKQVRALRIADNKLHELAGWNTDLLSIELTGLREAGLDMTLLGFSPDDLAAMMSPAGSAGVTDPDEVPAAPDTPRTQRGDVVVLGRHRLMCGDSSEGPDVDRLLEGSKIHLVNTDPPYNVKVEPRSNNAIAAGLSSFAPSRAATHQRGADLHRHPGKSKRTTTQMRAKDRPLENDFLTDEEFVKKLDGWFGNLARVLVPGGGFYIWGGYANCANYPPVLKAKELYFAQAIIWIKEHPVLSRKDFMGNHEWCFYGWREGAAHRFFGPTNVTDTWSIKKVTQSAMVHLTEKPVELARRALEYSSRPGEHVLDLFGGSGSTLIAAEQAGRRAFLMELDPAYCDVIVARWERFTGRAAERYNLTRPRARGPVVRVGSSREAQGSARRRGAAPQTA